MPPSPASDHSDLSSVGPAAGPRWLLWVDAAGGFLVLGGHCWTIGGPASEVEAAICVQADLQRQHAQLARVGSDYVLYPSSGRVGYPAASVASVAAELREPVTLRYSDRFILGRSVAFRFVQPSPLSSSARLTVEAPHRLRPHVDAVLLGVDALVIGPTLDCHVIVPHAETAMVLARRGDGWVAKVSGAAAAADGAAGGLHSLAVGKRLQQGGISLTLESA